MKNEKLYNQYAIYGWPCHFFTMFAADAYNARIETYCKRLPEGAEDLRGLQYLDRRLLILTLTLGEVVYVLMSSLFKFIGRMFSIKQKVQK